MNNTNIPELALTGMQFMLQACVKGTWINVYAINPDQSVAESDLTLANWYISTSPKSIFTQNLMLSIIKGSERIALNNNVLRIHSKLISTKKELNTLEDYQMTLKSVFNVNIDKIDLQKILSKITDSFS